MRYRDRVLERLDAHCDLATRLDAVPAGAEVRGVYFRSVLDELARRGLESQFAAVVGETKRTTFTLYPLADYLVWIALAGSIVASPPLVHEGMHELMRGNSKYFGASLLGRGLLRLISHDPARQIHQAVQSKRAVTNYGRWVVTVDEPRHVEVLHEDEYVWIGSALAGAARGGFESCGVEPDIEVRLDDPYNGVLSFRW
ncbi:MAG: DUF2378 family protein [Polyangiales bacterium]